MSIKDELERKYGGTSQGVKTPAVSTALGGAVSNVSSGKGSPVRADAAPRKDYSIRNTGANLKRDYGADNSLSSVKRYQDRVRKTSLSGLRKFREDKSRTEEENKRRHVMPGVNREGVFDNSHREPREDWETGWLEEFGFRYNADPESAYSFAQEINNYLNAQKMEEKVEAVKKWSMDNRFKAATLQILAAPLGVVDFAGKGLEYLSKGSITQDDDITPWNVSRIIGGALQEGLNENGGTLPENIPIIGGKGWGDVYSLGSSALQSIGLGKLLGSTGTLVTFFGQAGAAGVDEIKARGGSDEQALTYGLISGAAEALAEKLPLDNLLKGGDAVHHTLKSWLGNAMKQAGMEGTEELVTSVANEMADRWIMGDKSNFQINVRGYMAQGLTQAEAEKKAWLDYANDAAFDFIGGAASGAASMAVQTGPATLYANYQTRNAYTPEMDAQLLELAMETEEGSKPYVMAQKIQDKGKNMSGGQINDLAEIYTQHTDAQEAETLTEEAAERLEALDAADSTVASAIA